MGLYNALRPLVIGTVHGLAGSAAVAILVMTTIADPWWAMAYLLLFGLGTVAGMAAMTTAMAFPVVYTGRKMFRWNQAMAMGSGLLSVAFGMFISFQIGFGGWVVFGQSALDTAVGDSRGPLMTRGGRVATQATRSPAPRCLAVRVLAG